MDKLLVVFCKDFADVVESARNNKPCQLITAHSFVDGCIEMMGNTAMVILGTAMAELIDGTIANGYSVTAYVRLSDFFGYVPVTDEFENSVARAVNARVCAKEFPELLLQ